MFPSRQARWWMRSLLDPACRPAFLRELPSGAALLDVGCGNGSASLLKSFRNDFRIYGLDVADYNLSETDKRLMEAYAVVPAEHFAQGIRSFGVPFDAVLSSHNLEHCNDPEEVLQAMMSVVPPGGRIYLAFPCEASIGFPSRQGCLNFRDDPTHRTLLPFDTLVATLRAGGFRIHRAVRRDRGRARGAWFLGALLEPWSRVTGRVLPFTWYFWGFESVIVASRPLGNLQGKQHAPVTPLGS